MNRSMPPGSIIPELAYTEVREAVEWLSRVFGLSERLRIGDHRAQLVYGDGSLIVTRRAPSSDARQSVTDHGMMVRVASVDAHHERAAEQGAHIISPPADFPYGERQYTVEDIGGHRWTFSQTFSDSDPADWGGQLFESD